MIRRSCVCAYIGAWLLIPVGLLHGQTPDEAKAFFKEFDDATLHGRGPVTKEVYGGGDTPAEVQDRRIKIGKDIFDGVSDNAGRAINIQILDAHGRGDRIPADQRKKVADRWNELKTNGVLQRMSDLQLKIINKHFKTGTGDIDFAKFQRSVEMFANGELRPNNQMDQMYQWVVWKKFSEAAIDKDVNKASWEKILKSLQKGLEIHRTVYPSTVVARDNALQGELIGSTSDRFDASKQLTDQQKTTLRNTIDALNTGQILDRQKTLLKDMTPLGATAMAEQKRLNMALVSLDPLFGGYQVELDLTLMDENNQPDDTGDMLLRVYGGGLTLEPDSFYLETMASLTGNGLYHASFHWPAFSLDALGFVVVAEDLVSNAYETLGVAIPEPSALLLAIAGAGLLGCKRRRAANTQARVRSRFLR